MLSKTNPMFRFLSLCLLAILLFACGDSEAQSPAASAAASSSNLRLNEKGRVDYTAVLTFADGPFAGTYQLLKTKENSGSIAFHAAKKRFLEKRPQFAGKSTLSSLNMTTADGTFGIANLSRWFDGDPAVGTLPGHSSVPPSGGDSKCGSMQLHTDDPEGVIRHVYVTFLDCGSLEITGFGDEWGSSKYSPDSRYRPVAGRLSERVRIRDANSTDDTSTTHETTMTLTFTGAHREETD